ncbi:MAG: hypothetical protein M1818_001045 [Claussenomyces sp. TS43310]|nr:MAG: hypothetical protein M1818_001045 [Claussenomyces sp. TS43310]
MPSDILFLTGAPESSTLDWSNTSLLDGFSDPVARFTGTLQRELSLVHEFQPGEPGHPSWRYIDLVRHHLTTGHSQGHGYEYEYHGDAGFFATAYYSTSSGSCNAERYGIDQRHPSGESAEEILSQFYEHSFAVHEDLASSQIHSRLSTQGELLSQSGAESRREDKMTSFTSGNPDPFLQDATISPKLSIPAGGHLSDLEDIPNASYLHKIQPQTMTVNLIVGIISISTPRSIRTRRGADVQIVELLVGDDTKSGFGVTFWLGQSPKPNRAPNADARLPDVLSSLRPQDVVLIQNMALSTFREKVHGQSLRKERTRLHLLYRNRISRADSGGCYRLEDLQVARSKEREVHPQIKKTMRVREWVLEFVGAKAVRVTRDGNGVEIAKETLPPDTQ